jgi:hypothetical protein
VDGRVVGLEHTVEFDVGHLAVVHLPTRGGKFVAGEVDVHHLDVFRPYPVRVAGAGE